MTTNEKMQIKKCKYYVLLNDSQMRELSPEKNSEMINLKNEIDEFEKTMNECNINGELCYIKK